ncbi:MAG: tetratricopeptide repeat protein [Candidatus Cyclonatronum sp.]|uniref:tetratricopeptide repeat protein n=1 Tax=Cyclonatronum sp. TaxID=3024185 RepID=UPI0025BC2CA8|nr:tetratricopeptide repeat protein [Cyclonatronum sp.]MCC5935210.1 tetratricopeptide repeat protein [Balneolales bacterium]MCH8487061.1 tetratricopeptide repeat protein [Cyclonatronum sp.]
MPQIKNTFSVLIVSLLLFSAANVSFAQDRTAAVEAFNAAQELLRASQFPQALDKFQETRSIARQAGSDADDIRERAEAQIPAIQVQIARASYQARNFEQAVTDFDKAYDLATELGNTRIAQQVAGNTLVVMLQWGNTEFNANNNDRAEEIYRMALERNANYPNPYYQLGLIERRRNNLEGAIQLFDQAIQVGTAQNRTEVADQARNAARDYLTFVGSTQIEEGNFRRAVELLNRSLSYDNNHAETLYRLSEAHNQLGNWAQAVTNATRALENEQGGQVARARIFFELGYAQMNQGNDSQACTAFRSAAFGNFRAAAEHHMEHDLSCP